ncbi:MAG: phage major tail tube protein [Alphaproteobacteria bacterium]|nr:phage major tail tube protein [Alphaproteobacteria bacterium]
MSIPKVLKNFSMFVDGYGFAGRVDEVGPPKLAIKTEEFRGGGMDAPGEIDMGMEKLEASFTVSEHDPVIYRQFGLLDGKQVNLTLRGAQQGADGAVVPMVCTLRGMYKELDAGNWKAGDKGSLKASMSCRYYKLEIDGSAVIEIDVDNMTRVINGADQMAAIRAALGM